MALESVYESLEYESNSLLRKYKKRLKKINAEKDELRSMSDIDLKSHFLKWISEIDFDYQNKKHVNHAIALAREVTFRLTGKFQYDVQVLGALAATERNMIQMSTGSGKTLTLILPVVVFGLTHKGVDVLTVNDYLSKRDWEETHPIYDWFGLTNAYTSNRDETMTQRNAFSKDITYCTNATVGFAYLNSELASDIGQDLKIINRPLFAALIDEADEVLMDDAQNPLIIASSKDVKDEFDSVEHDGKTFKVQDIVEKLKQLSNIGYESEGGGQMYLTDEAFEEIEDLLGVDDSILSNQKMMHVIYGAVSAIFQHKPYTDYVVADEPDEDSGSRIILIDKATGRLAKGRTMSDDMHVFLEMKEGVFTGESTDSSIQITYQILFNLFHQIAGLSGTLGTSYAEFKDIYGTGVVIIPDRTPNKLKQMTHVYMNQLGLYDDLISKIKWYISAGHPILVGATSDIGAEIASHELSKAGIEHTLLVSTDTNEDVVVQSAGRPGSVVVTTDIMGRGTDIKVDTSHDEDNGGLVVFQIGSRQNSRVERQFAGRAARQGQPGRYHRMLVMSDMDEIGMNPKNISDFLDYERHNRKLIQQYHGDLMLNGRNPDYAWFVDVIDKALISSESAISSNRVQEFRSYSIIDIVQTSLLARLDDYRKIIKDSAENDNNEPLYELAAKLSIPEGVQSKKLYKLFFKQQLETAHKMTVDQLRELVFVYTTNITGEVIPRLRDYADTMTNTTKLAGQVKYERRPEDMMVEGLKKFLQKQTDYMLLKLPDDENQDVIDDEVDEELKQLEATK